MRHYPSLPEIVAAVEALLRPRRKKALQGRKPRYSDERIIALAVYQHLWRFRYAQACTGCARMGTRFLHPLPSVNAKPSYSAR